jgi:hypothetical protein
MTDAQRKFVELAKQHEAQVDALIATREQLEAVMKELGVGSYTQDEVGTVYKIVKPKGTFTYYRDLDYTRTALTGERAGSLSKKEAEEAGFVLKK